MELGTYTASIRAQPAWTWYRLVQLSLLSVSFYLLIAVIAVPNANLPLVSVVNTFQDDGDVGELMSAFFGEPALNVGVWKACATGQYFVEDPNQDLEPVQEWYCIGDWFSPQIGQDGIEWPAPGVFDAPGLLLAGINQIDGLQYCLVTLPIAAALLGLAIVYQIFAFIANAQFMSPIQCPRTTAFLRHRPFGIGFMAFTASFVALAWCFMFFINLAMQDFMLDGWVPSVSLGAGGFLLSLSFIFTIAALFIQWRLFVMPVAYGVEGIKAEAAESYVDGAKRLSFGGPRSSTSGILAKDVEAGLAPIQEEDEDEAPPLYVIASAIELQEKSSPRNGSTTVV